MSLDLDALEAIAKLAESDTRAPLTKISKADMALVHATPATVILEMIALIRRQERELIEARERRSEPSAVRVTIVDERAAPSLDQQYSINPARFAASTGAHSASLLAEMGHPSDPAALAALYGTMYMNSPAIAELKDEEVAREITRALKQVRSAGYAREGLDMVDHRLRQILNPPAPFHGEKWAAADALYWLTGDQAFADQADGLAAESLNERNDSPLIATSAGIDNYQRLYGSPSSTWKIRIPAEVERQTKERAALSRDAIIQSVAKSMDNRLYFLSAEESDAGIYVSADIDGKTRQAIIEIYSSFEGKAKAVAISLEREDLEQTIHAMLQLQTYLGWD